MKNKYLTSFLALFGFGIHRFYLQERGNGIAYFLLTFIGIGVILSMIDFLAFLFMDQEKFDYKYNRKGIERRDFDRRAYREYQRRQSNYRDREPVRQRNTGQPTQKSALSKAQLHIKAGKENYAGFDYLESISHWLKAIEYEPRNAAVHYNLSCAYSLTEQSKEAFYHLSEAVKFGFNNFEKLNNQDALAFLRIQPDFDEFAEQGYKLKGKAEAPAPLETALDLNETPSNNLFSKDILEQLKELGELRDRGILTEEEFAAQKKKLI